MELEKCGVKELDSKQMTDANGGSIWIAVIGAYMLYEIAGNPGASWASFKKGFNWE